MHKGYAFVQFSHPDEARRAGASEDGKNYAGQAIGKLNINVLLSCVHKKFYRAGRIFQHNHE